MDSNTSTNFICRISLYAESYIQLFGTLLSRCCIKHENSILATLYDVSPTITKLAF